jgi:signal transduction histidine kinase
MKQLGIPFYRAKKIDVPGTGLGFTLIRKIVDMFSWTLDIKSTLNVGTEIIITINSHES